MPANHISHQNPVFSIAEEIHSRAIEASRCYRKTEFELIELLQDVDHHRVYLQKGYSSLFQYVVQALGLSESVAYNLIAVSRKAGEVPGLKLAVQSGSITLSNARKITPLITNANQSEWLEKASTLSQRQLEKEIVKTHPRSATPEKVKYVTESRVQISLGLSEKEILKLRKAQDLLSQSSRRSVSLEEVLMELTDEYLQRHDPIEKAKRSLARKGADYPPNSIKPVAIQVPESQASPRQQSLRKTKAMIADHKIIYKNLRQFIPANILHQVNLRDQLRCTHLNPHEIRCTQSRFIEIHHKIPVSEGGKNTLGNLITLCSSHHSLHHQPAHNGIYSAK